MKKHRPVPWQVDVAGERVVVIARTAGAAARLAFRQLIRTPRGHRRRYGRHVAQRTGPLGRQPRTLADGGWENTTVELAL